MSELAARQKALDKMLEVKELIEVAAEEGNPNKNLAIRTLFSAIHYFERDNYILARYMAIAAEGKLQNPLTPEQSEIRDRIKKMLHIV